MHKCVFWSPAPELGRLRLTPSWGGLRLTSSWGGLRLTSSWGGLRLTSSWGGLRLTSSWGGLLAADGRKTAVAFRMTTSWGGLLAADGSKTAGAFWLTSTWGGVLAARGSRTPGKLCLASCWWRPIAEADGGPWIAKGELYANSNPQLSVAHLKFWIDKNEIRNKVLINLYKKTQKNSTSFPTTSCIRYHYRKYSLILRYCN